MAMLPAGIRMYFPHGMVFSVESMMGVMARRQKLTVAIVEWLGLICRRALLSI
jgi:hypothetical protein